jgi:hypothetical protein
MRSTEIPARFVFSTSRGRIDDICDIAGLHSLIAKLYHFWRRYRQENYHQKHYDTSTEDLRPPQPIDSNDRLLSVDRMEQCSHENVMMRFQLDLQNGN